MLDGRRRPVCNAVLWIGAGHKIQLTPLGWDGSLRVREASGERKVRVPMVWG